MAVEFLGFGMALFAGGGLLIMLVPEVSCTFAILQPAGLAGGTGVALAVGSAHSRFMLTYGVPMDTGAVPWEGSFIVGIDFNHDMGIIVRTPTTCK